MDFEDIPGFAHVKQLPLDTEKTGIPCAEWGFSFPNGMIAIVRRTARSFGTRYGYFELFGYNGNRSNQPIAGLPECPLIELTQDEVVDWLYHISTLGQNGTAHPTFRYPIAYFLFKFRRINSEGWCEHPEEQAHGRHSALGWCEDPGSEAMSEEALALSDIFGDPMVVIGVNDGADHRYSHPSPKVRIMSALRDKLRSRNAARAMSSASNNLTNVKNKLIELIERLDYDLRDKLD